MKATIYQSLYAPQHERNGKRGVYEVTHHVPDAPWVQHGHTQVAVPKHLRALHDRELARHQPHIADDGSTRYELQPVITGIRIEERANGTHVAHVNVRWEFEDGVASHGIHYTVPLSEEHATAHRKHLAKVAEKIPVNIRRERTSR